MIEPQGIDHQQLDVILVGDPGLPLKGGLIAKINAYILGKP
jgi:hypothetical protein